MYPDIQDVIGVQYKSVRPPGLGVIPSSSYRIICFWLAPLNKDIDTLGRQPISSIDIAVGRAIAGGLWFKSCSSQLVFVQPQIM